MLPIRWDPFRDLSSLHKEIDNLFRRTFGGLEAPAELVAERGIEFAPSVNTFVKGDTFYVQAELPGVSKKDLDVSVEGKMLTIRGERKESRETKEEDYLLRESRYGSFLRRLTLPEGVNTEKIHASYDSGILEVTMPMEKRLISGRKVTIEGPEEGKRKRGVH